MFSSEKGTEGLTFQDMLIFDISINLYNNRIMSNTLRSSGREDNRPELKALHEQMQGALAVSEGILDDLGSARQRLHGMLAQMDASGQRERQVLPLEHD